MIRCLKAFVFLILFNFTWAQDKVKLPKELNEISGLEKLNDSVLIAINDGGNSPDIFFINLNGEIIKKCRLSNALNVDWEDLTMDDQRNLYIADVGNNRNARKDLCILKVNADQAFQSDSIRSKKISLAYADQDQLPPPPESFKFDCEALFWMNDSLHLITKNRAKKPKKKEMKTSGYFWDRFPEDYVVSNVPGSYLVNKNSLNIQYLMKVRNSGIKDLITSVDYSEGVMAVLTYSELKTFGVDVKENKVTILNAWGTKKFKKLAQRESIVIFSKSTVFIASEKHLILGGPHLIKITFP